MAFIGVSTRFVVLCTVSIGIIISLCGALPVSVASSYENGAAKNNDVLQRSSTSASLKRAQFNKSSSIPRISKTFPKDENASVSQRIQRTFLNATKFNGDFNTQTVSTKTNHNKTNFSKNARHRFFRVLHSPHDDKHSNTVVNGGNKRSPSGHVDKTHWWPGGIIPFVFDSSLSKGIRNSIKSAMKRVEYLVNSPSSKSRCVRFVKSSTTIRKNSSFYYLNVSRGSGCHSTIGFVPNKAVELSNHFGDGEINTSNMEMSIGKGCETKGIILHELMHVLGFYHEHNRWDRNSYISVDKDNILKNSTGDFTLYKDTSILDTFRLPYDFGSITHYGPYTRALDLSKPVIRPIRQRFRKHKEENEETRGERGGGGGDAWVLGQRDDLSKYDVLKIQRAYGCREDISQWRARPVQKFIVDCHFNTDEYDKELMLEHRVARKRQLTSEVDRKNAFQQLNRSSKSGSESKFRRTPEKSEKAIYFNRPFSGMTNNNLCNFSDGVSNEKSGFEFVGWVITSEPIENGPSAGHSTGIDGYLVAIGIGLTNGTETPVARIVTPFSEGGTFCLAFYLFQKGPTSYLDVLASGDRVKRPVVVKSFKGDNGNYWRKVVSQVDVRDDVILRITLEARVGDGSVAVDDFRLYSGKCE